MKSLAILLTLIPFISFSQCKTEKFTDPVSGKTYTVINTPSGIGKLMVGKTEAGYMLAYSPKNLMSVSGPNQTTLNLDSVTFIFSDNTKQTFKTQGIGVTRNTPQIKPYYSALYFGLELTPDQFTPLISKQIKALHVKGEQNSEGGDSFNDKQTQKLKESFECISK